MIVLLFCFFFFFQTLPAPPRPGTHQPLRLAGWVQLAPAPPGAFVSAAPGVARNSALPIRQRGLRGCGGGSGDWSPLSVPDRCLCPLKAPGQGAWGNTGGSGSHGGTSDLGIRDQESDPEPAAEGEGTRRGCRGRGARSWCRLPAVPSAAALPPLDPLFAAPLFPESLLPQPPPADTLRPSAILGLRGRAATPDPNEALVLPRLLALAQPAAPPAAFPRPCAPVGD